MGDINFEETKAVWESRLVGKQIVDMGGNMTSSYSKRDLPPNNRVIGEGTPASRDFRPGRINVHVNKSNICTHVTMG